MEALNFSIEGEKEVDDDLAILCTYFSQQSDWVGLRSEKQVPNKSIINKLQNPEREFKQANMTDKKNKHLTPSTMAEMKKI